MKEWRKSEYGTITVYLAVILASVMLFTGVLIDLIRIKAAAAQSEMTLKSALNSALSLYNPELKNYGLFALTENEQQVEDVIQNVVKTQIEGSTHSMIGLQLGQASSPQPVLSIAAPEIFHQQVLEQMKYSAPIEFTKEFVNAFSKLQKQVESTKQMIEHIDDITALIEQREQYLDTAFQQLQEINSFAQSIAPIYRRKFMQLQELLPYLAAGTKKTLENQIAMWSGLLAQKAIELQTINQQLSSSSETEQDKEKQQSLEDIKNSMAQLQAEIASAQTSLGKQQQYKALAAELYASSDEDYHKLLSMQQQKIDSISKAKEMNNQLAEKLKDAPQSAETDTSMQEALRQVLIYSAGYFVPYVESESEAAAVFGGLRAKLDYMKGGNQPNEALSIEPFILSVHNSFQRIAEIDKQRRAANDARTSKEQESKRSAETELNQGGSDSQNDCTASADSYNQLAGNHDEGLYQKYLNGAFTSSTDSLLTVKQPETSALEGLTVIQKAVSSLVDLRNTAYLNEYALTYFNYRTLGLQDNKAVISSHPEQHALAGQEVEYILYGKRSCLANRSAAYMEMYMIRFTIRTMESLAEPSTGAAEALTPIAVLFKAMTEGAIKAKTDMDALLKGEGVAISSKLPGFRLDYKDYLRFLLLIHYHEKEMTARIMALIELNTGVNLQKSSTYIRGSVDTFIRLWFVPSLFSEKNLGSKKYAMSFTSYASY